MTNAKNYATVLCVRLSNQILKGNGWNGLYQLKRRRSFWAESQLGRFTDGARKDIRHTDACKGRRWEIGPCSERVNWSGLLRFAISNPTLSFLHRLGAMQTRRVRHERHSCCGELDTCPVSGQSCVKPKLSARTNKRLCATKHPAPARRAPA